MQPLLLVSSRAALRLAHAADRLADTDPLVPTLVLGPSRRACDDFVRGFAHRHGGRFGTQRFTPIQLATEVASARLAEEHRAPLTRLAAEALAVRAVHRSIAQGELRTYASVAQLPGFPAALGRTVEELRMAGTSTEVLDRLGSEGHDLEVLFQRYEQQLQEFDLADRAFVFRAATEVARGATAVAPLAFGGAQVWLDLLLDEKVERDFLCALAQRAERLVVTLPAEADEREQRRRKFETLLETEAVDLDDASADRPGDALTRVQRYVFAVDPPSFDAQGSETTENEDRTLEFFSASGEGQECVEIARQVRKLASEGLAFDCMAVLVRSPTTYLPLLEDALRRADVPAYFSRGTSRPDPAGRAFLSLLACAGEGVSASRFAEYLSLGQVPTVDEEGAPPVREVPWVESSDEQLVLMSIEPELVATPTLDGERLEPSELESGAPVRAGSLRTPFRWESMLVDAAVVGGLDRWQRRLTGLHNELQLRLRESVEDEARRFQLERQIDSLSHLENFALPLVGQLASLPAEATWGVWLEHLEKLAVRALRRPESVLELLAELRPMSDVGPVSMAQVQTVLSDRLTLLRTRHPRRRYGRLFVASLPESLALSCQVVFLPGMAEGIFPKRTLEDPLLLDELREQLRGPEEGLFQKEQRLASERLLLHLAVGAASSKLVVSYPRVDVAQGRQRVPSFYALDLLRAAEGRLPDVEALQRRAVEASAVDIGWPAPRDPDEAIDAAEFDLALLKPLLTRPARETRGHGQFLLRSNEHLARSLRARARRWRRSFHPDDGMVKPSEDSRLELERNRMARRSYSPTALQNFAGCPYRFYLQAIVRLRPRDRIETVEQLDPLTRGSLFHDTQFELFGDLRERGLLPVRPETLADVLDRLDHVFGRLARRYEEELAPAIPQIWKIEMGNLLSDLRGWIKHVAEDDWRWQPVYAELAFGLPLGPERDASSQEEAASFDGVHLRGSIDLVEAHALGRRFRVTDHKTGRVARDARGKDIRTGGFVTAGGKVLQPLLYAMAAETMLADSTLEAGSTGGNGSEDVDVDPPTVEAGRLYYCTQRGGYQVAEVSINEPHRNAVRDVLRSIDGAIADGFLPAVPGEGECRFCDYRSICGPYEHARTRRKNRAALTDLKRVRETR